MREPSLCVMTFVSSISPVVANLWVNSGRVAHEQGVAKSKLQVYRSYTVLPGMLCHKSCQPRTSTLQVQMFYTAPTLIRCLMKEGDDHVKRSDQSSICFHNLDLVIASLQVQNFYTAPTLIWS